MSEIAMAGPIRPEMTPEYQIRFAKDLGLTTIDLLDALSQNAEGSRFLREEVQFDPKDWPEQASEKERRLHALQSDLVSRITDLDRTVRELDEVLRRCRPYVAGSLRGRSYGITVPATNRKFLVRTLSVPALHLVGSSAVDAVWKLARVVLSQIHRVARMVEDGPVDPEIVVEDTPPDLEPFVQHFADIKPTTDSPKDSRWLLGLTEHERFNIHIWVTYHMNLPAEFDQLRADLEVECSKALLAGGRDRPDTSGRDVLPDHLRHVDDYDLTVEEAAETLGVDRTTVVKWRNPQDPKYRGPRGWKHGQKLLIALLEGKKKGKREKLSQSRVEYLGGLLGAIHEARTKRKGRENDKAAQRRRKRVGLDPD